MEFFRAIGGDVILVILKSALILCGAGLLVALGVSAISRLIRSTNNLENFGHKNLKEKVQNRIKQALNRKIGRDGYNIAWHLGEEFYTDGNLEGRVYKDSEIEIRLLTGTDNARNWPIHITFENTLVFIGDLDAVSSYLPGRWERKLKELNRKAELYEADQNALREEKENAQLRKKFGL